MSGKPWPEGVTTAMQLLDTIAACETEAVDLHKAAVRLKELDEVYAKAKADLRKLLNEMDVSPEQKGNFGWEGRFGWFLEEMHRQARGKA